ncbi:MAG: molybdopterin-guanine dinucleotide biosynthesis protein B [Gemmatimonadota bacterium]
MATRIISVVGLKNAGKTTLVVALASEFNRRRKRVMTIKHASHPADMDRPGTDTYRHFHEGRAERVLIASPDLRAVIERTPDDTDPVTLARTYLAGADIVLVEGFKAEPIPKMEVFRLAAGPVPLYSPDRPDRDQWIAIVTDDEKYHSDNCPVLRFRDTAWLQLLAGLAWDKALVI